MATRPKVALVGISGYGDTYLEALLNNQHAAEVELVGTVDPAPQRCRRLEELRSRRVAIHPSLPALFASTPVDLVMISAPIHLHAPQTVLSLQRGAHVLCEKPIAGSLGDAQKMVLAQRKTDRIVAIGYQWSFSKAVQDLKRDILAGALGRPVRLKTIVSFPRGLSYFNRNDWAGRIRTTTGDDVLDSPVNNATAHYLHNMLYLLGESRELSAVPATVQAELYRANDIENYDTAAMRVVTHDGAELLFYTTHAMADRLGPKCEYQFENALVSYDPADSGQFIARFNDGRTKVYGNPNADRNEKIWQTLDAMAGGQPVACNLRTAIPQTLCAIAAQQSMPQIAQFPRNLCRRLDLGDDTMIVVGGLEEELTDCFDRGVLPSEHAAAPWARAGIPIEVFEPDWSSNLTRDVAEPAEV